MNVSIIIPNYNGEELLRKNLPKVFEAANYYAQKSNSEVEVIIVDDASVDESINFIKLSKLPVKLIENEKNLGFSSTVNIGVKNAEGEIVVLLNTDVVPEKDFLIPLMQHFKDPRVFAVGCMDKSIEGSKTILRGRGIGEWERGFLVHRRGDINKTTTLWVSGGSGAFKKSVWEKLGGFNELYNPFYWEDIDLSYRALKSGYKILFEPKSIVIHQHQEGAIITKYSQFDIKVIAYRNQIIFAWENATNYDLQLFHIMWLPYHLIKAMISLDMAFLLGFFQACILLPKIIWTSLIAQRYFVKSDKQVIQELHA